MGGHASIPDQQQQIAGLRRAIASESTPHYLAKPLFASALLDLFRLEVSAKDFFFALSTWEVMQRTGIDQQVHSELQPVVDQINVLRTDDQAYAVTGQLTDSAWTYHLFKNWFHVAVSAGRISDVQLLCVVKYIEFKYDPNLDYRVLDKFGQCLLVLSGDAGTQFQVIQH